ncbi:MAG: SIS domain-containing protein [Erysipelotrichaceae bacterium]|nr:SIS domain-containing protein [Erysipelotrichaceae bacterium]
MANTMMTYIDGSKDSIDNIVENRKKITEKLVDLYLEKDYHNIWIVACGSSYNGSLCGKPFMMKYLDTDVKMVNPNNFICGEDRVKDDDFVVFVSQSGCSTNTIEAIEHFKKMNRKAVSITANADGDFKDHADYVIDWSCGEETVGYVTKGVSTLALFFMCFALEAAYKKKMIDDDKYDEIVEEMKELGERNRIVKEKTLKFIDDNYKTLTSMNKVYSVGFSQGFSIASEGALKMGETIKIPSFAYEAEEYIHGPNLQLNPTYSVFFVDDMDKGSERLETIYKATKSVTDNAFMLTDRESDDPKVLSMGFDVKEPLLSPVYCLSFFQTLAYSVSDVLNTWDTYKLMKIFNETARTKTDIIYNVMPDIGI